MGLDLRTLVPCPLLHPRKKSFQAILWVMPNRGPPKQRRCSTCGQVFASPSAWMKHLQGGSCMTAERMSTAGFVPTSKGWEVREIAEGRRGR